MIYSAADVAHHRLKINPPEDTCGLVVVNGHKGPAPKRDPMRIRLGKEKFSRLKYRCLVNNIYIILLLT